MLWVNVIVIGDRIDNENITVTNFIDFFFSWIFHRSAVYRPTPYCVSQKSEIKEIFVENQNSTFIC